MLVVLIIGVLATVVSAGYGHYRARLNIRIAVQDIAVMSMLIKSMCEEEGECPATLPASVAGKLDPWGRPYRYLAIGQGPKGQSRKDHSLVPINSDFDLYSVGPDGNSSPPLTARGSRDDIVRASDGAFIGVASDY